MGGYNFEREQILEVMLWSWLARDTDRLGLNLHKVIYAVSGASSFMVNGRGSSHYERFLKFTS